MVSSCSEARGKNSSKCQPGRPLTAPAQMSTVEIKEAAHMLREIVICRRKPVLIDIMKRSLLKLPKRNRNGRPASVGSYGQTSCERYLRNGGSTQQSTNGAVDTVDIGSYETHYETQTRRRESNKAVVVANHIPGIETGRPSLEFRVVDSHIWNRHRSPQSKRSSFATKLPLAASSTASASFKETIPRTRRTAVVRRHQKPKALVPNQPPDPDLKIRPPLYSRGQARAAMRCFVRGTLCARPSREWPRLFSNCLAMRSPMSSQGLFSRQAFFSLRRPPPPPRSPASTS